MESSLVGQGIAVESEGSLFKPYKALYQAQRQDLATMLLVTLKLKTDETEWLTLGEWGCPLNNTQSWLMVSQKKIKNVIWNLNSKEIF